MTWRNLSLHVNPTLVSSHTTGHHNLQHDNEHSEHSEQSSQDHVQGEVEEEGQRCSPRLQTVEVSSETMSPMNGGGGEGDAFGVLVVVGVLDLVGVLLLDFGVHSR